MFGHALMGCPAAILETMVLVFSSYIVVCIVDKKAMTFPVWVLFLNLCDKTPVFLRHIAYYESNVIQRMIPHTNVNHSRNPYQGILSHTISTVVIMDMRNVPTTQLFHWDLPISIVSTP